MKIPKANRKDDEHTIAARAMEDQGAALPCNNLKLMVTPPRTLSIFQAWQIMNLREAELVLLECERAVENAAYSDWAERFEEAERARSDAFERLIRIPATKFHEHEYKRCRRGSLHSWRQFGSMEWLQQFKPKWAAILDKEHARLTAEKAERIAKKREGRA